MTVAQVIAGLIQNAWWSTSGVMAIDIRQRATSHRTPELRYRRTNATARAVSGSYQGGLATSQRGTLYNGIVIGGLGLPGAGNAGPYRWTQQPPTAANTLHTTAFTVTRRRAFRIPE
jgi:hypothetical protein